ncbi:GAF domain-containing protein [candidate division KSB1 bacterium]|nr:GAF domain-containing protein [candidate division KSB1 bacterium]
MRIPRDKDRMLWVVLLFVAIVAIGFFIPVSIQQWSGVIIKGGLFLLILVGAYVLLQNLDRVGFSSSKKQEVGEISNTAHVLQSISPTGEWKGFSQAFHWFVLEYLSMLRGALVASYAGYFLRKNESVLVLQSGVDEHGRNDYQGQIHNGTLVQEVIHEKQPVLKGNLDTRPVMDGFADSEIQSFIGVPLRWDDDVLGVLAFGSRTEDCFGEEDVAFLKQAGSILTHIMSVFRRGLRWETDQQVLEIHLEMEKALRQAEDETSALIAFVESIKKLFPFDRVTLSLREGDEGVIHQVYGQIDQLDRGTRFSLDEGLNGWVMKRNAPLLIPDMEKGNYARPRYYQGEDTRHGFRCFLGVPLGRGSQAWGCLSLESKNVEQYGEKGKEMLFTLLIHLEAVLERIYSTSTKSQSNISINRTI